MPNIRSNYSAPESLVAWVAKTAEKTRRTQSSLVQEALEMLKKKMEAKKR